MSTSQPDFKLNRPGALIAALPAVLGFIPEKSLVLVTLERGEMGAVMRADLSPRLADTVDGIAEVVAAVRPDAVIAVIVDAERALCPGCGEEFRELSRALTDVFALQEITLLAVHVVDRIAAGGSWHCADMCGARGTVDDPSSSPLAMAAVLDGRRLYARREDLLQVIDVTDTARVRRLARRIRKQFKMRPEGDDESARRDVEMAIAVAERVRDGAELTDAEAAELACAITDINVRDTLFALAVGEKAAEAETLWVLLSRALPHPRRVEALVLLAFSAYARGDGPLAGVGLDAAVRNSAGHRMASMLDTALQSGLRPEGIRELAVSGYRGGDRRGHS